MTLADDGGDACAAYVLPTPETNPWATLLVSGYARDRSPNPGAVRTAGIDLSSQPVGTAACVVDWRDGIASVESVENLVDDGRLKTLLADTTIDQVGIDVPLGWPDGFVRALQLHRDGQEWPQHPTKDLTHRATDRWLIGHRRIHPLSVSTDRIAYPAMRAAALTAGMARDGSGRLVEVYPAAALNVWHLPYQRYKRSTGRAVLSDIIAALRQQAPWLVADERSWKSFHTSDHAFDALVAALIARAHARGLCHAIPDPDREAAIREGWICVPSGTVDALID
jgi:Protein of unknown function (DUF429)